MSEAELAEAMSEDPFHGGGGDSAAVAMEDDEEQGGDEAVHVGGILGPYCSL